MKDLLKATGYAIAGYAAIAVVWIAASFFGAIGSVATAPSRVVSKTLETNNVIANYEFFRDAHNTIQARARQIAAHRKLLDDAGSDPAERTRLRIEVAGMQQSCRELAAQYNANASKLNRSIFMGSGVPESINTNICE